MHAILPQGCSSNCMYSCQDIPTACWASVHPYSAACGWRWPCPQTLDHSEKFWTYISSSSSKVIDLGANRKRICNFLLSLVVTLVESRTVFEIWRIKLEDSSFSPPRSCLMPRSGGTRQNFWVKFISQKLERLGYSAVHGESFMILPSTIFDWSTLVTDRRTNGRTDGRAITRSALYMHVVARLYQVHIQPVLFQKPDLVENQDLLYSACISPCFMYIIPISGVRGPVGVLPQIWSEKIEWWRYR